MVTNSERHVLRVDSPLNPTVSCDRKIECRWFRDSKEIGTSAAFLEIVEAIEAFIERQFTSAS